MAVANPHDRFFKATFRHRDVATAEIMRMVPPPLLRHLDLDRLALDEASLLDAGFRELFSDRLFRVPLIEGGEVFVWILIEHQSTSPRMMALRLLEYAVARWRSYRLLHRDAAHIPLLIPIVVQHSAGGWTAPAMFSDLYNVSEALLADIGPYVINFRYLLDDLQSETEASLAARCPSVALRAVLLALKTGGAIEVTQASKWRKIFDRLAAEQNVDLIHDLIWYLLQRGSKTMINALEQDNTTVEHVVDNILDRKYLEGATENARQMLRTVLETKPGFQLNSEAEARLQSASVDTLQQWLKRLFLGESPAAVLGL